MLKKYLLLLILVSCAHGTQKENNSSMIPAISMRQQNAETSPGQIVLISIPKAKGNKLVCEGKELPFYRHEGEVKFIWGESYFSEAKQRICEFKIEKNVFHRIKINITAREYPSEELRVDGKRVTPNPADVARVKRERAALSVIYSKSSSKPLFVDGFVQPLDSFITSHYGKKRVFNGVRKSQHLGVDLRARTGTPIPVANDGVIVFAGELFYSGNTVIVDHGLGVFTTYGHLSKIIAKAGEPIRKMQVIGLAGSTGRVTGPHLHWGVKIHDKWVDGMALVEQTQNISWQNYESL